MKIKELESMLSVSKANIRFYEKEGLLAPARSDNNYRDYTDEDVAELKKIVSLRKLGFTVNEIAMLQKGEKQLNATANENIKRLEEELASLKEALELTKSLASSSSNYSEVNADELWNTISAAEDKGAVFVDICKDFLELELTLMESSSQFFPGFKHIRKEHGMPLALGFVLLLLIIRGLAKKIIWQGSFWDGFFYPLIILGAVTLIILPIWYLRKKSPKIAEAIMKVLSFICIAFLLAVILLFVILLIKSCFE